MIRYIIMVEGAHDLGVIGSILQCLDYKKAEKKDDLSEELQKALPKVFPFKESGKLERITPIPDYYYNDTKEILLIMANGENRIFEILDNNLYSMKSNKETLDSFENIIIFIDSDDESDRNKKISSLIELIDNDNMEIIKKENMSKSVIDLEIKNIDVNFYCFPNDSDAGVLEDIIWKSLDVIYNNNVLEKTIEYVDFIKSKKISRILDKGSSGEKKALVSCLGNTIIEASSSGTVYINKSKWIKDTVDTNLELKAIKDYLEDKLQ